MEAIICSPIGNLLIIEQEGQLAEVAFTEKDITTIPASELIEITAIQFDEYFNGHRQEFDLPLNPVGTEFQQKVWQELLLIPFGTTVSYQEVANRLGDPKCIRAAARANGQNPIAIIIPCHRVIGTHGEMTGYAGGIQRKKDLLTLEGADVMNQMNLF
jgi:methylated-DNA-[protein]-cysteine S-methyltransferase